MPKVNMETLLPFIEEAFSRGLDFQIPITGTSMNPLLYQGRDFVFIEKPTFPLEIGDIPLYRRSDGAFVLHRVVDIKENGEYVMCGDNQFTLEYGITDKHILAKMKCVLRDGQIIDESNKKYRKYIKRLPVRRFKKRVRNLLGRIYRKIFKKKTVN